MKLTFNTEQEWLEARKGKITSTMASAILGLNPYMNSVEAWEILVGIKEPQDISDKPYVQYGKKAEEHIRDLFLLNHPEYKLIENDKYCLYIDDQYPFLAASGDGMYEIINTIKKGTIEIKTTEILASSQRETWKNGLPQNYFIQCLMEMRCMGTDEATLIAELKYSVDSIWRREYTMNKVDVQEDIDYVVKELVEFYNKYVVTKKRPPLILNF